MQQVVDTGRDIDAEALAEFKRYQTTGVLTISRLAKACDTIEWHLKSSAFELTLILDEQNRVRVLLAQINAQMEQFEAEDESDVYEDELVEEMVNEFISKHS